MMSHDGSTDIYDAKVGPLRESDNAYELHTVASRKPPKIATNWRTTSKLKTRALVAVVKRLPKRGAKLVDSMELFWGELVTTNARLHGKEADIEDARNKAQGRFSVRLLGEGDCPGFPPEADMHLSPNDDVAIIDCRVFVPEVLSVLSALSNKFAANVRKLSFYRELLGGQDVPAVGVRQSTDISAAIMNSTISLISALPNVQKSEFADFVCKLSTVVTLDETQRQAFVAALLHPLHCTQGPPGTGKVNNNCSYLMLISFLESL